MRKTVIQHWKIKRKGSTRRKGTKMWTPRKVNVMLALKEVTPLRSQKDDVNKNYWRVDQKQYQKNDFEKESQRLVNRRKINKEAERKMN